MRRRGPYVYPFRHSTESRTDQGKDFTGTGAIGAIGRARILKTGAPGWPEGGGVLYKLLEGPLAGKTIFVYEGVNPTVRAGQVVDAGQQIATFRPGGSIEIGFADEQGVPLSHSEYTHDGIETRFGKRMADFLSTLKSGGTPNITFRAGTKKEYSGIPGVEQIEEGADAVSGIPGEVTSGLVHFFTGHAESLALNVFLLVGGLFLVIYGTALLSGVEKPAKELGLAIATKGAVK